MKKTMRGTAKAIFPSLPSYDCYFVSGEVTPIQKPYFFTLKSHKSQAARSERGGSGTRGENNLTVFDIHTAHSFSRVREKWARASVKGHSHSGKCYPKGLHIALCNQVVHWL